MVHADNTVDVVIVGGGVAGLSAALMLGRARRRVLVCSGGAPRNAPSGHAHGFLTRDGVPPGELLRLGRADLAAYPHVEVRDTGVCEVSGEEGRFAVTLEDGARVEARRILLATGVVDELPEVEGLRERWGSGVFHCPYCHGWEVRDQPLAVYGNDARALHLAILLPQWSRDLTLLTDGPASFSEEERARLARRGVTLREEPVARLEGADGTVERVVFADGGSLAVRGVFVGAPQRQRSDLAERLGCAIADGYVRVDASGLTTTPGVYAAGDMTGPRQQLMWAAGSGVLAGASINGMDLVEEEAA